MAAGSIEPGSPKDLVARAKALSETDKAEAFFLLVENRPNWDRVPQAYDVFVGRLGAAANLPQATATYLQRAIDAREAAGDISANLLKMHGEALRKLGRIPEAAGYFARAVAAGADTASLSAKAQMALAELTPDAEPNSATEPASPERRAEYTVFDSRHRALLVYVPKVACTVLKATVVMNSPLRDAYLASGQSIHRFVAMSAHGNDVPTISTAPEIFRWTVIRDPARRLLSAYLNKFVAGAAAKKLAKPDKVLAIRGGQRLAGLAYDPVRSISFAEFVRYLMTAHDLEMNVHWMPQSRIVGTDIAAYHHIGCMEQLDATFAVLAERFGYVAETDSVAHLAGAKRHSTSFDPAARLTEPHLRLPNELRKFRDGFPPAEAFLTPDLTAMIEERYAADLALHQAALAGLNS